MPSILHRFYLSYKLCYSVFLRRYHKFFLPFFYRLTDIHSVYPPVFFIGNNSTFLHRRNEVFFSDNRQIIFPQQLQYIFWSFLLIFSAFPFCNTDIVHENLCCPQISLISILYKQDSALCRIIGHHHNIVSLRKFIESLPHAVTANPLRSYRRIALSFEQRTSGTILPTERLSASFFASACHAAYYMAPHFR